METSTMYRLAPALHTTQTVVTPSTAERRARPHLLARLRQLLRYFAVSCVATGLSQTILATLVATRATSPATANVIATLAGVVPSFELNRRWVWGKRGRRSVAKEVVPFTVLSLSGLGLSTLAVWATSRWVDAHHVATAWRTLSVQTANLTAFGLVWIAQFVILDRVLFRHHNHPRFPESSMPALTGHEG
jgi:putative flippase GtrA